MSTAGSRSREPLADHLIIAPVVLPLVAGAAMLLLGERRRSAEGGARASRRRFALVGVAIALLGMADAAHRRAHRPASTGSATGRRRSGSCWCSTGCRR